MKRDAYSAHTRSADGALSHLVERAFELAEAPAHGTPVRLLSRFWALNRRPAARPLPEIHVRFHGSADSWQAALTAAEPCLPSSLSELLALSAVEC